MTKYKVEFQTEDIIEAKSEKEAESIFWDRFDNSVWKADVKEFKEGEQKNITKKELDLFLKKIGYWEGGDYIGIEVKNKNKPNIELQGLSVREFESLLKRAINFGKNLK